MTALLPYLQTILAIGNLCIMLWALKSFLNKPQTTMNQQIETLKKRIDEQEMVINDLKKSLDISHDKHRDQDKTNKVFKKVFILLANFEVAFCQHTGYEHTEDLVLAKKELEEYLAGE